MERITVPITPDQGGSIAGEEHTVLRYPDGRIVPVHAGDLAAESAVVSYFQKWWNDERSLRAKRAEKAKAE